MAVAGYSGTPLIKKLGIRHGMKIRILNKPGNYFELLDMDISNQLCKPKEQPDLVHVFAESNKEFEIAMKKIIACYKENPGCIVWVSWYKKSAGIPTDLTEDVIRAYALKNGLVDIKVCAVSDTWSGLKLVVPLHLR